MGGSRDKKYIAYFADSPGQSDSKAQSTDKTKCKTTSASPSSRAAIAIVDSSGKHTASTTASKASRAGSGAPGQKSPAPVVQKTDHASNGSDSGSDSSGESVDSGNSERSDSSPEPFLIADSVLERKKREVVDRIMTELFTPIFEQWMEEKFGVSSHAGGGDGQSAGQCGNPPPSGGGSRKRQRRQPQRDGEGEDSQEEKREGGDRGRNGQKRIKKDGDTNKRRVACPYYKHDPAKYGGVRTCCGPGWHDVHRLKEHLFRNHQRPEFFCPRCNLVFKDGRALTTHAQSAASCTPDDHPRHDGFNLHQAKLLKTRSRNTKSECQKWEEVYRILFPDDTHIPTPYYDGKDDRSTSRRQDKRPEVINQLERYLTREMPPMVEQLVLQNFDKRIKGVEEGMAEEMMNLFYDAQQKCFRTFRFQFQASRSASPESGEAHDEATGAPSPTASLVPEEPVMMDPHAIFDNPDLANQFDPDNFSLETYLDIIQPLDGFGTQTSDLDSAYYTASNYTFNNPC